MKFANNLIIFPALQLLYCAGWVHRDISDGNILAHRPNLEDDSMPWKGKLMDLEYARKFPPEQTYKASADPKTVCSNWAQHTLAYS